MRWSLSRPGTTAFTHRMLRRRGRVWTALSRAGIGAGYAFADHTGELVGDFSLPEDGKWVRELSRVSTTQGTERRLQFTRFARRVRDEVLEAALASDPSIGARDVVAVILSDGRQVYLHDPISRTAQHLWLLCARDAIEASVPRTVFSYRAGTSHLAALYMARRLVQRGYTYAHRFDIESFFDRVTENHVATALRTLTPLDESMINVARFFLAGDVRRFPDHPAVRAGAPRLVPSPRTLLQGSVIAPILSNVVAASILDLPFTRIWGSDALLLRYADDGLILARSAREADAALERARALLAPAGFHLHPSKTTDVVRDLTAHPVPFLGKQLRSTGRRGEVHTDASWFRLQLGSAAMQSPGSGRRRSKIGTVLHGIMLDPVETFDEVMHLANDLGMHEDLVAASGRAFETRKSLLARAERSMDPVLRKALSR